MVSHRFLLIIFPAQGHINPALQLAKRLIAMGGHVTLLITLHMYRSITNKITIPGLSILPFSDGFDDGFAGSSDRSVYFSEFERCGSEFARNLIVSSMQEGCPFTCLVHVLPLHWAAEVARGFHLPTVLLCIQPTSVLDILYYYFHGYRDYIDEKITNEPSGSIELPKLPFSLLPGDIPSFLLGLSLNINSIFVPMFEKQFHDLDLETKPTILVNTFEELEPEELRAVDEFNVIAIGPLIPSAFLDGKDPTDTSYGGDIFIASNDYVEWLDSKPEASVVYISFGSYRVLSKTQMEEMARALLDCGFPFLWVIREQEKQEELSCREELEKRGKLVNWCSQVEVLSHRSLGCFVTHCGSNSTMESLACGVPMVAFPQRSEQNTNGKLIEDVWKTGVRVDHRVDRDEIVKREEIKRCLEQVMGSGEKREELRKNAKKWKDLARDAVKEGGSSEKNLRAFLNGIGQ